MYIEKYDNQGIVCLRLVRSRYSTSANGEKYSKKETVKYLGPLSKYDDGKPDFYQRLKESYKNGTPILKELEPYITVPEIQEIVVTFRRGTSDCNLKQYWFADSLLNAIFRDLGLGALFANVKANSKIQYDLTNLVRLVVYGRILEPASKWMTISQNERYVDPLLKEEFNKYNIYDMLSVVHENRKRIFQTMNRSVTKNLKRDTSVLFYDVTNFFFEIDEPDPDVIDEETEEVIEKGLRKMGVSKEQRKQPIVQMGLFMDRDGIPIATEQFPGNTLDHQTVKAAIEAIFEMGFERFVFVGDRGMCNYKNCLIIIESKNGYLVSKSIQKSTKKDKEWILNSDGYTEEKNEAGEVVFKYKSRVVTRKRKNSEGKTVTFDEKMVVYWSRNFYNKQKKENESFLKFIEELEKNPNNFRISVANNKNIKKFLDKKKLVNKKTGEMLNADELRPYIDWEKVNKFKDVMGYYQIITSETEMEDKEVISVYHELNQIEYRFHIMKSPLETRPFYVRTPEHIDAHLVLCTIALTIFCLIQKRIKDSGLVVKDPELEWFTGLPDDRLQRALNNFKVVKVPDWYFFSNLDDVDLKLILDSYHITLKMDGYTPKDLRAIRGQIKAFEKSVS